jgi:hypothetical protein
MNKFAIGSKADSLFCEYVQTFSPNISYSTGQSRSSDAMLV